MSCFAYGLLSRPYPLTRPLERAVWLATISLSFLNLLLQLIRMLKIGFNSDDMRSLGDVLLGDEMTMLGGDIWQQSGGVTKTGGSTADASASALNATFVNPLNFSPLDATGFSGSLSELHQMTGANPFENTDKDGRTMIKAEQTPRLHTASAGTLAGALTPTSTKATEHRTTKHAICQVPDCSRRVRSRGFCKTHGGGRKCAIDGCNKSSQNGDLCIGHGGGKKCKHGNCSKAAQSHGLCKAHGGGARCKFPNCTKSSQGGGLCRAHGGGKRCQASGCPKGAQRGNFCATHGGFRCCKIDGCVRTDRGGGYCEVHRRDKLCKVASCKKLARNLGMCTMHIRQQKENEDKNADHHPVVVATVAAAGGRDDVTHVSL